MTPAPIRGGRKYAATRLAMLLNTLVTLAALVLLKWEHHLEADHVATMVSAFFGAQAIVGAVHSGANAWAGRGVASTRVSTETETKESAP